MDCLEASWSCLGCWLLFRGNGTMQFAVLGVSDVGSSITIFVL